MKTKSVKKINTGRHSPSRKEMTRMRILETAARAIRRSGCHGTGVADIMKEAGLTHGGFYAHFASRDEMLAEAVNHAALSSMAVASQDQSLETLMKTYLSDEHVVNIEIGCCFAALGSELPRQVAKVREVSTLRIKDMIHLIERHMSNQDQPNVRQESLVMLSTMVGALILARATDDPDLSTALRQAVLQHYELKDN